MLIHTAGATGSIPVPPTINFGQLKHLQLVRARPANFTGDKLCVPGDLLVPGDLPRRSREQVVREALPV
ncbi:MAG: hypothetical protein JWO04_3550 [Gammaproteobacteria bacterium]|nr:hypothetical protein [Gammaproteobacteria bacterium]